MARKKAEKEQVTVDTVTIFDMMYPTFKIDVYSPIELFAGVGQAMALRDLGEF